MYHLSRRLQLEAPLIIKRPKGFRSRSRSNDQRQRRKSRRRGIRSPGQHGIPILRLCPRRRPSSPDCWYLIVRARVHLDLGKRWAVVCHPMHRQGKRSRGRHGFLILRWHPLRRPLSPHWWYLIVKARDCLGLGRHAVRSVERKYHTLDNIHDAVFLPLMTCYGPPMTHTTKL